MRAKITADHLERTALVYVRQSTPGQVRGHVESQRRQYALADVARELGFRRVETIDDDLGISGSGFAERPGFQRLLTTVCSGAAGAVLALEASRLARNDRDWSQLVALGAITKIVLIDHDGIYDPRLVNDRLLLGLNRPDSYSTSYSTSHGAVNLLLKMLLGHRGVLRSTAQYRPGPQTNTPRAATEATEGCAPAWPRRIAFSVSEFSREPPSSSDARTPCLARDRHGGKCSPRAVT
jgi:Resolvase, N terminal domain